MNSRSRELPSFEAVDEVIQKAVGVVPDRFLDHRAEDFNFWQQPPFEWVDLEPGIIDHTIFSPNVAAQEQARLLILAAANVDTAPGEIFLDEVAWESLPRKMQRQTAVIRGLKTSYLELLGPVLANGVNLDTEEDLKKVAQAIQRVKRYLLRYPFVMEYIQEMVQSKDGHFLQDGTTKELRKKGEFQISSYAGFAANRGQYRKNWDMWVGLHADLPDDSANVLFRQAAESQVLLVIRKIMTG